MRLGSRVVERTTTKRGGDAAHKTSFGPDSEVLLSPLAFLVLRSRDVCRRTIRCAVSWGMWVTNVVLRC